MTFVAAAQERPTPQELVRAALREVSASHRSVLAAAYRLDDTPEGPGEDAEATSTALRSLRHPTCLRLVRAAVLAGEARIWAQVAGGRDHVLKAESEAALGDLVDAELLLAVDCCYGGIRPWLDLHAQRTALGWYRTELPAAAFASIREALSRTPRRDLPLPLATLASRLAVEPSVLRLAIALSPRFTLYRGYVMPAPWGTRSPRAVRLHGLLAESPQAIVELPALTREYRSRFPDDPARPMDLRAALSVPHLFLWIGGLGVSTLGTGVGAAREDLKVSFFRWSAARRAAAGHAAHATRAAVVDWLTRHGASRTRDLLPAVRAVGGCSALLAIALRASDRVLCLAPGLYDLAERRPDARIGRSPQLLEASSCLHYVMARHAGEPMGAYPLWTSAMEADWCEWALAGRRNRLLGPLLEVADPATWPVSASARDTWLWRKECIGRGGAFEVPAPDHVERPRLTTCLAVLRAAVTRGTAGWVLVNRVRRSALHGDAWSVLAVLIGLEALAAPGHWQRPHPLGPRAQEVDAMLDAELHAKPDTNWEGACGQELLARLTQATPGGWLPRERLQSVVRVLAQPPGPWIRVDTRIRPSV